MTEEEIIKQLEENKVALEEVRRLSEKTAHYVKWLRIFDVIKIILILIPLIAAYLYLPGLIKDMINTYNNLLGPALR